MAKFFIEWKETVWYGTLVEADTLEEAQEKFHDGQMMDIEQVDNTFEGITHIEESV